MGVGNKPSCVLQNLKMAARRQVLNPATSSRQGLTTFDRLVLDLVDRIPPGRVMTYGSIADWLGQGSPRLVARVMSTKSDSDTPWQRVLRSDGSCAPEVADRQLGLLRAENAPFKAAVNRPGPSERIDLRLAHWSPDDEI